tara:strand:+ start:2389 stop:2619 length:231 start_codon:yes stop_codon:yes gene_type:complete
MSDFSSKTWNQVRGYGSPFDRGSADSYYDRPFNPHYNKWVNGKFVKVLRANMTNFEVDEYYTGYIENEKLGHKKEY